MDTTLVIALIELILVRGPEAAVKLIGGLDKDNITPEDIRALKVKDPDEYFEEG